MEQELYVIAYDGKSEIVDGEDFMNERVCEICNEYGLPDDEVHVFAMRDEL